MNRRVYLLIIAIIFFGFISLCVRFHSQEIQDSRDKIRKQGLFLVQIYKLLGSDAVVRHNAMLGERR
ncbi:MAG: hypothetical protein CBD16_00640 [Betaproteobacteria bacterium TMED156]|nr:MAG: hypothetical protein CBD16_00640 [Betaproteobacteria bacterium TMED156]|tara:strand:- start:1188 stop:1388 length:201 start_codon:yes stop_codon:yes gene_type:complete